MSAELDLLNEILADYPQCCRDRKNWVRYPDPEETVCTKCARVLPPDIE